MVMSQGEYVGLEKIYSVEIKNVCYNLFIDYVYLRKVEILCVRKKN